MRSGFFRLERTLRPAIYAVAAPVVWGAQHLTALALGRGTLSTSAAEFWLLPLRQTLLVPDQLWWMSAISLLAIMASALALAILTFRRANWAGRFWTLAAFVCIPGLQIAAFAIAALLPRDQSPDPHRAERAAAITLGLLTGIGVLVLAALVSTVILGVYGWGLFVASPLTIGLATAWFANRQDMIDELATLKRALAAMLLGTVALTMFALEGIVCVLMAAPLGALAAGMGSVIGRWLARLGRERRARTMCVAIVPLFLVVDLAMPSDLRIDARESVVIAAPPAAVWDAIISDAPVRKSNLFEVTGLAFPLRSELRGEGVGAERLGYFSTGIARERVSLWEPEHTLAFTVVEQPPAMRETGP